MRRAAAIRCRDGTALRLNELGAGVSLIWIYQYDRPSGRFTGKLFRQAGRFVEGERIALPLAGDGVLADGVLGASDYRHPHLEGPFEIITENEVWDSVSE